MAPAEPGVTTDPEGAAPLVRVLTLNTWGLWLVSKDRVLRMRELGHFLRTCQLDVVLLQEVWVDKDAQYLISCAKQAGLQHAMHFKSGIFGSGLITISRYAILESGFHRYNAAGDATAIHCGDFFTGKGVGWVRLAVPGGPPLLVFNTHPHANYSHACRSPTSSRPDQPHPGSKGVNDGSTGGGAAVVPFKIPCDGAAAYRLSHMLELAQLVRYVGGCHGAPVILGGDLNTKPYLLEMMLLRHLLPELTDCWTYVHGDRSEALGYTCCADGCTYKSTRQVPERIDYLLVHGLEPRACDVTLRTTRAGCSYSDHFAVQARLSLKPASESSPAARSPQHERLRSVVGFTQAAGDWALYTSQGQQLHTTLKGTEANSAVLDGLQHLLPAAMDVLSDGIRLNARHKVLRLLLSALLFLVAYLACGLPHCPRSVPPPPGAAAGAQAQLMHAFLHWCALLPGCIPPLISAVAAAGAMLLLCIGGLADATQARVLQQSHAQLRVLTGLLLEPAHT